MKNILPLFLFLFLANNLFCQFSNETLITKSFTKSVKHTSLIDVNADGINDILTVSESKLCWFKNTGGGIFDDYIVINDNLNIIKAYAIDINQDGFQDIIAFTASNVYHFLNTGNSTFSSPVSVIVHSSTGINSVDMVDLDNDGDVDIIASVYSNDFFYRIVWSINDGNGSFSPQQTILPQVSGGQSVKDFITNDMDNDADLDIIIAFENNEILWIENQGGEVFSTYHFIASISTYDNFELYLYDINSDNEKDLITVSSQGEIKYFENLNNGTFDTEVTLHNNSEEAISVCVNDFDNDGDEDIIGFLNVTTYYEGQIEFYENLANGTFNMHQIYTEQESITSAIIDDCDSDNKVDIISTSSVDHKVAWYKNLGSGNFDNEFIISSMSQTSFKTTNSDVDNDGDEDVFLLNDIYNGSILSYYENLGSGNFSTQKIIATELQTPKDIKSADIDNDGLNDILYVGSSGNTGKISGYENLGNGLFSELPVFSIYIPNSYSLSCVELSDIDGDGLLDLLIGMDYANKVVWYRNQGNWFFGPQTVINSVYGPKDLTSLDLDGDGDNDILCGAHTSSSNDVIMYYQNQGNGTFLNSVISTDATGINNISVSDLNNDGFLDIVFSGSYGTNDQIAWIENIDNISWGGKTLLTTNLDGVNSVETADIDQDGDIDIICSSEDDSELNWFENMSIGVFSSEILISNSLGTPKDLNCVDIDNDGDKDIFVPSQFGNKLVWFENYTNSSFQLKGEIYIDNNQNGINDIGDTTTNLIQILTSPQNAFSFTFPSGKYVINVDTASSGIYQVFPTLPPNWSITSDSLLYNISFDNALFFDSLDFGVFPTIIDDSIDIQTIGGFPRCDNIINYWVNTNNVGTSIPSGIVSLELDPLQTFINSEVTPDSIVGQVIYWHIDSLFYFDSETFRVSVLMPDFNNSGDVIRTISKLAVLDQLNNITFENTDTLNQVLVCAYDPNVKTATPVGIGLEGFIPLSTNSIEYLVRFQNTGTDTAQTVIIKDQLDDNLDWTSITPLASSHEMFANVNSLGEATFSFNNIMLPDSNVNEIQSHGFVLYRINLLPNLLNGTEINNTANIYFDNNPAVITNTKKHTLDICIDPFYASSAIPNVGFSSSVNTICVDDTVNFTDLSSNNDISEWDFGNGNFGSGSQTGYSYETPGFYDISLTVTSAAGCSNSLTETSYIEVLPSPLINFNFSASNDLCTYSDLVPIEATPAGGIYSGFNLTNNEFSPNTAGPGNHVIYYSFTNSDQCTSIDSIVFTVDLCLGLDNDPNSNTTIYPNPFNEKTTLKLSNNLNGNYNILIYNSRGQIVYSITNNNDSNIIIDRGDMETGVYLLKITQISDGIEVFNAKLIME